MDEIIGMGFYRESVGCVSGFGWRWYSWGVGRGSDQSLAGGVMSV